MGLDEEVEPVLRGGARKIPSMKRGGANAMGVANTMGQNSRGEVGLEQRGRVDVGRMGRAKEIFYNLCYDWGGCGNVFLFLI